MPSPKSEPSGRTTAALPPGFRSPDDQGEEQVRRLSRPEMLREIRLDPVLFFSAEGRIGQHDIHALVPAPGDVGTRQRIVMTKEGRVLDAVQQQVGDGKHVGEVASFPPRGAKPAS